MAASLGGDRPLRAAVRQLDRGFDAAFGPAANPLRQLGALAFAMLWLLGVTGIVLYTAFDTSLAGAWRSIDALSQPRWNPAGVMRSLHRYAADAFALLVLAHLVREALLERSHGFRRFSWWTGVALLPLTFVAAVGGFWLNWDALGQFSAIATAEWLDRLPFLGTALARNFLGIEAVGDRLFSLLVFVHIGVPLLLVFGLWFHIQRISRAIVFPRTPLAVGTAATMAVLALAAPVASHSPADLASVAPALAYDWLLLFVHPLGYATSFDVVWALLAAALAFLVVLPFVRRPAAAPVAVVDPQHCNGCRRCFDDCPYAAITMVAHPTQRGRQLASVDADLCASCGICAGACPSSTPFRGAETLATGIDMPSLPIDGVRRRVVGSLAALGDAPRKIVVFGCAQGVDVAGFAADDVAAIDLVCIGQLPPSFVDFALRDGAAGVLVSGCAEGGCEFRLGQRWTAARLRGAREPRLRASVPRERVAVAWADRGDDAATARALQSLRDQLAAAARAPATAVAAHDG